MIDYSLFAIKKGRSEPAGKGFKRSAFKAKLAKAYEEVNDRDGNRSRVTGRRLFPSSRDFDSLRDHNHMKGRNVAPELVTNAAFIFLCSRTEHNYIHAGDILVDGETARKPLRFRWNRRTIPPGKEPFKLLSKRRSQNRVAA